MSKISQYDPITDVQPNDLLVVVDVDDGSMASSGTTKKMTVSQLPGAVSSVNGQTGAVNLTAANVGADAAGAATGVANAIAAEIGAVNGIASLNSSGLAPQTQLAPVGSPAPSKYAGLLYGAVWGYPWQFWPDSYGVQGNGTLLSGVSISASSNQLTGMSSGATGQVVVVLGAGPTAGGLPSNLVATISGMSGTTGTLAANATTAVTGGYAVVFSDDTANMQTWMNRAYSYALAHDYARPVLPPLVFGLNGPTVKGGVNLGNTQIPVGAPPSTGQKIVIDLDCLGGVSDYHWQQVVPQLSGAVLLSALQGQTVDGTWGAPSVIGGPTQLGIGATDGGFANLVLKVRGNLGIACDYNPTMTGLDASSINIDGDTYTALALGSPAGVPLLSHANAKLLSTVGVGIAMPAVNNNDIANFRSMTIEGYGTAISSGEHFTAQKILANYCRTGLFVNNHNANNDGISIGLLSTGECGTVLTGAEPGTTARIPLSIGLMECESASGQTTVHISDTNNNFYGRVLIQDNTAGFNADGSPKLTITGAQNLEITCANLKRGLAVTPAVPAASTNFTNPYWRPVKAVITGGSGVVPTVDGLAVPAGTQFAIRSGGVINLGAYTGAPTWQWVTD